MTSSVNGGTGAGAKEEADEVAYALGQIYQGPRAGWPGRRGGSLSRLCWQWAVCPHCDWVVARLDPAAREAALWTQAEIRVHVEAVHGGW